MFIKMLGSDVKNLMAFTYKLRGRPQLTGVSIKQDGEFLEFAATDGGALYVLRRKLMEGETAPEKQIVVMFPKLKYKNLVFLEDIPHYDKACKITTIEGERGMGSYVSDVYPNYKAIIPEDLENVPLATDYTGFSLAKIKQLEMVVSSGMAMRPKAKKAREPHFWQFTRCEREHTVVLMPLVVN
jgi:hypothetical protein